MSNEMTIIFDHRHMDTNPFGLRLVLLRSTDGQDMSSKSSGHFGYFPRKYHFILFYFQSETILIFYKISFFSSMHLNLKLSLFFTLLTMATIAIIIPVVLHFQHEENQSTLSSKIIFITFCLSKLTHFIDVSPTTVSRMSMSVTNTTATTTASGRNTMNTSTIQTTTTIVSPITSLSITISYAF